MENTSPPSVSMSSSCSSETSSTLQMLLQILDRHARIGDQAELRIGSDQRLVLDVMLVGDVANDFFHQVLDGDEPVGAAIFVDHQRQVQPRRLHLRQKIEHRHRAGT